MFLNFFIYYNKKIKKKLFQYSFLKQKVYTILLPTSNFQPHHTPLSLKNRYVFSLLSFTIAPFTFLLNHTHRHSPRFSLHCFSFIFIFFSLQLSSFSSKIFSLEILSVSLCKCFLSQLLCNNNGTCFSFLSQGFDLTMELS
jgi:hypothetical protein